MTTSTVQSLMNTAIADVVNLSGSTASSTLAPQGIVGVYYDGQCYYQPGAFTGYSLPSETTAFGLASVTKTFSTAIIGQLGADTLTKEIGKHVPPQFSVQSSAQQCTLSQLAGFCSGLPSYPYATTFAPKSPGAAAEVDFIEIIDADEARYTDYLNSFIPPMLPAPYIYSDIAIGLASQIAMYQAGHDKYGAQSTLGWWSKNLFAPLGMANTGAFDQDGGQTVKGDPQPDLMPAYAYDGSQSYQSVGYEGWCPWGAAGRAYSTCEDMLSFVQALVGETTVNGKAVPAILTAGLEQSLTPVSPPVYPSGSSKPEMTQALAWVVNGSNPNAQFAWKDGSLTGISSYVTVCPDLGLGTVILTNMEGVKVGTAADNLTQGLISLPSN